MKLLLVAAATFFAVATVIAWDGGFHKTAAVLACWTVMALVDAREPCLPTTRRADRQNETGA